MKSLFPRTSKRYFVYWRTGSGVTRRELGELPVSKALASTRPRRDSRTHFLTAACESEAAQERYEELIRDDRFMASRFAALLSRNPESGRRDLAV